MNQKGFIVPLVIAIAVVVFVGAGAFVYVNRESGDTVGPEAQQTSTMLGVPETAETGELTAETEAGTSLTGTVTELLQKGRNLTCTFTRSDEGGTVSGTVYVASQGERFRGDFMLNGPDGTPMHAHVIRDGEYGYFWSDEQAQGTKTALGEDMKTTGKKQEGNQQDVLDEAVTYDCQPWTVDASKFNLPVDKEFVDISQQVQQINATTKEVQASQCAVCGQLEGSAQAQCRQALGC